MELFQSGSPEEGAEKAERGFMVLSEETLQSLNLEKRLIHQRLGEKQADMHLRTGPFSSYRNQL